MWALLSSQFFGVHVSLLFYIEYAYISSCIFLHHCIGLLIGGKKEKGWRRREKRGILAMSCHFVRQLCEPLSFLVRLTSGGGSTTSKSTLTLVKKKGTHVQE